MSALSLLASVAVIHLVAMASPGPNVLLVTQTAMSRSRRSALMVAFGVSTGSLILSTGAAVGLSLVFEGAAWVRHGIQVAGGAYLVYLGVRTWLAADEPPPPPEPLEQLEGESAWRFYSRGLLTNLTNPKAAVFFGTILAPVLDRADADWVVVAAGLADKCEVQVAYAIGVAHPVSVMVETFGTEKIARSEIARLVDEHFDLRPGSFRQALQLHRPIYQKTAAYGHFGREDHDFTWEKTDKADDLRQAAGLGTAEPAKA